MEDLKSNEEIQNEDERQKIKEKLSHMSFEELQKLKLEMGTKLYSQTISEVKKKQNVNTSFKRANKNRPREMSSKRPEKIEINVPNVKKQQTRDPRFEPMCGTFDKKSFKENYKFINDLRKQEKEQLKKALKSTVDERERKKIKFLIQRLTNQIQAEDLNKEKISDDVNIVKKREKPHYKKKSVKKLESLINKFEDLKKTNKIKKHIERKAKKITAKERKKMNTLKLP